MVIRIADIQMGRRQKIQRWPNYRECRRKPRDSDRQRLGVKIKGMTRKNFKSFFKCDSIFFKLDMLPTTGSSSTLQAGTTEARNPDRSEFNRTSVQTVTVLDIEKSTVTPLEKQHSLRPAHRENVIEHKLVRENLTYKQRFVDIVKLRNKENVRRFVKKQFAPNNTLLNHSLVIIFLLSFLFQILIIFKTTRFCRLRNWEFIG